MPDLPPQYNPHDVEARLYQQWEESGLFHAQPRARKTPYTIVIPPPNVTGILHMGHALNNTIQDILIRWKRMQGFNALWVPGTDHAGIATQNVVEKQLAKEGLRRQDLGREKFLERVWAWKERYGNTIISQLKRLGTSCDWQRTRFTMDEGLSDAVTDVFIRLYKKGLIYRGQYIINWCPRCQTALSDEEAPRKETKGKLWFIRYPLKEGERLEVRGERAGSHLTPHTSHLVVATTRPETMLGDTAVAVHPKDKRYQSLVGRRALLPLVGRELPIIADEAIDPGFGTGAVKVTPAHDPVDFQLGKKHGLEFVNVMMDDGRMTNVPQSYQGLDRFDCRKRLLADLEGQGLLEKVEERVHGVGHCYRCDTVIEPRLSLQWFVRMKPLAKPALEAVKKRKIVFTPSRWTKVYLNWMDNIQDWCISRQIWWGHRLPVWYCKECGIRPAPAIALGGPGNAEFGIKERGSTPHPAPRTPHLHGVIVSKTRPERCPACGSTDLKQDEDVLDTWFSSWLWPFSTLGWPKKTKDLDGFYPTDALVTAPEIIFFWVARMIMAGLFCMKEIPFRQVYIHGTVRDLTGKKMSKSLGNIIDPLDIIEQFGADALRYTLITSTAIGTDVCIAEERFAVGRNFVNKLWNAARFILQTCTVERRRDLPPPQELSLFDRAILDALNLTIASVTENLQQFRLNDAADQVYGFVWHLLCDWHIEWVKPEIAENATSQHVLRHVVEQSLRLLHPTIPFVTDELWQHLRPLEAPQSIMVAPWPHDDGYRNPEAVRIVQSLTQLITDVRNIRAEFRVPVGAEVEVAVMWPEGQAKRLADVLTPQIQRLARVRRVTWQDRLRHEAGAVPFVFAEGRGCVDLANAIDVPKARWLKEKELNEGLRPRLAQLEARLQDEQFMEKAPQSVVGKAIEQVRQVKERIEMVESYLKMSV